MTDTNGRYFMDSEKGLIDCAQKTAREIIEILLESAQRQGDEIRRIYGREPTKGEAERIAENLEKQVKLALIFAKTK